MWSRSAPAALLLLSLAACAEDRTRCEGDGDCPLGQACLLGACQPSNPTPGPSDAGVPDIGPPPPMDASVPPPPPPPPPPRDAGMPPQTCPDGTEGCACASSLAPDEALRFRQDDCDDGLRCVPWDLLSGRFDLAAPVQSCVRPCDRAIDCGPNQVCTRTGFSAETGADAVCVDRVAADDRACGLSRAERSRIPGVSLRTPRTLVGCEDGSRCITGALEDLHPDEGVCVETCAASADCLDPGAHCNPDVLRTNGPAGSDTFGVCQPARIGQGSICGTDDPEAIGLLGQCDTSLATPVNTICVPIGGLTPDGLGICMTPCDDGGQFGPCTGTEPDGTPQTCSDPFFTSGAGVCNSGCTNYPDDQCGGDGEFGLGRFCMAYLGGGQGQSVGLCMDRRPPPLTPARLDPFGMVLEPGQNCFAPGGSLAFTQCPSAHHCEIVDFQQGVGLCIAGCGGPQSTDGNAYCARVLGESDAVCVDILMSSEIGACAAP